MRKNIDISDQAVSAISSMALDEDRSVKNMIERNLEAMARTKTSYTDLYTQYEALSQQLKQLSK